MVLANDRLGLAHGPKMPRGLASALSPPVLIGPREPGPVDAVVQLWGKEGRKGDEDNPPCVVCAVAMLGRVRDILLLFQPMGQGHLLHWHWHGNGHGAGRGSSPISSTSSTVPRDDAGRER